MRVLVYCTILTGVCTVMVDSLSSAAYQPQAKGEDIVSEISADLNTIFPDHGIMKRTACVESNYGQNPNTYRPNVNYFGGIWQVDKEGFDDTQNTNSHPRLNNKFVIIMQHYNINWREVTYNLLERPLYSGIAARLYYSNIPEEIPTDKRAQATYWKKYYNTGSGRGNECNFLACSSDKKRQLESDSTCPCGCGKLVCRINDMLYIH